MYFNFIKREGLMLSPARNRSRAAVGPVPSFGVAPTQPVPSGRFPTTMYEDRTMLSAFSRSLAPARPLRRVLTLTVALALGALPVGASAVVPHPQTAVAAVQPPRNNADTEYNTCVERLVGDASPTPGVWAVCRGYLDEDEYVVRRRHDATVTRAELVRLLYRMAGSPAVKDLPAVSPYADVPASDPDYAAIIWAADATTASSTPTTAPAATPSPRSCTVRRVAPRGLRPFAARSWLSAMRSARKTRPHGRAVSPPRAAGSPALWASTRLPIVTATA